MKTKFCVVTIAHRLSVIALVFFAVGLPAKDPLPAWRDGAVKRAVLAAVDRMTLPGGAGFVPPADRIATFDNDGTLWQEQPVVQGAFVMERLKKLAASDASWRERSPFREALQEGISFFGHADEKAALEVLAATHSGMSQSEFESEVSAFFKTARHPQLKRLYRELAYVPMVELLELLRSRGFKTFLCSGGGVDFMRVISESLYGIAPEQVIGSHLRKQYIERGGKAFLWRTSQIDHINDKAGKPVGIDWQIGKHPVFAAGNVRSGGDVPMLQYSQQSPSSFQLVINHDDPEREFAYTEADNATLGAARAGGWQVVSMKNDWRTIFALP